MIDNSDSNNKQQNQETLTLLEWISPSRPFKKKDRDYFTTIGAMVFLIVVILLFMKEWLLIGAILALTFMVYVLNTIPPENVTHKITNNGIISAGHTYVWTDLREFWFIIKNGHSLLVIQTKLKFPGRIILLLNELTEEKVKEALKPHLLYKETPEKTWMDNAADWLGKKVPLEKIS